MHPGVPDIAPSICTPRKTEGFNPLSWLLGLVPTLNRYVEGTALSLGDCLVVFVLTLFQAEFDFDDGFLLSLLQFASKRVLSLAIARHIGNGGFIMANVFGAMLLRLIGAPPDSATAVGLFALRIVGKACWHRRAYPKVSAQIMTRVLRTGSAVHMTPATFCVARTARAVVPVFELTGVAGRRLVCRG